ncbi:MAG: sensor histidine kinase [Calditrichia bacterium]
MVSFRQVAKINALFWSGWLFLYAAIVQIQVPQIANYGIAIFNSLTNVLPLFLLSLLVWPLCKWLDWRKMSPWFTGLLHFVLANIYTILWQVINFGGLYLAMGERIHTTMDVKVIAGWQYPQGLLIYMMVAGIYYTLLFYYEVKERELRESKLLLSLRESEWKALKAQINPHFLFNALNSVNALITGDPHKAREMLVKLSGLLRKVLTENPTHTIALEKELEFVQHYVQLEKIRLEERLDFRLMVADGLAAEQIPVMLLQPLIENAIKHGISPVSGGGWVELSLKSQAGGISGQVRNSIGEPRSRATRADGTSATGLNNLAQRLQLLYGDLANLDIRDDVAGSIFEVSFFVPPQLFKQGENT